MLLVKGYPCLDFSAPEKHFYLASNFSQDNVFYGRTTKLTYKNSNCIFSIKSVFNGSITYAIDGNEKMIEPGEFLVVTSNTCYECYIDSDGLVEDVCVQFTDETIHEVFRSIVSNNRELLDFPFGNDRCCLDLKTISFSDQTFLTLLKQITSDNVDDVGRDQLKLKLLSHYFCNYYSDQLRKVSFVENENLPTKLEILKRVNSAKDFLHSNYDRPIDLQQTAIAACLSPSHLIRKFKEVFRVTPYQYLRKIRLRKAIEQLKNCDLPVEQIGYNVGFDSPSSFIRAFRETYNTTPGALRKQQRGCTNAIASLL